MRLTANAEAAVTKRVNATVKKRIMKIESEIDEAWWEAISKYGEGVTI